MRAGPCAATRRRARAAAHGRRRQGGGRRRAGRLDRAPAQIVAEIAAGVARGAGVDAGAARGAQQFRGMRAERLRVGVAGDRSFARAGVIGVGPERGDGIAGAGLDPDMRRCGAARPNISSACGRCFAEQLAAVRDRRRVGDGKDVADEFDVGERRAAQPRQPRHQRLRRIIRRAGKRAEAGDEDAEWSCYEERISLISASPRSVRRPAPA